MALQPGLSSIAPSLNYLHALHDARRHTLALIEDLTDEQMMGPQLEIVNPPLWEIGHVAWFQEYWVLRHLNRRAPILPNGDALYDSAKVAHDTRWHLPLPSREHTLAYMQEVLDRITDRYQHQNEIEAQPEYFLSLSLFHEDMHDEAFGYTRQTLGYPIPYVDVKEAKSGQNVTTVKDLGDAQVPGGRFLLGSLPDRPFVFDNEMDAHEVEVEPFAIARTAVTNAEFAAFVDVRGYEREEFWSDAGWRWRQSVKAQHPVYWQRDGGEW